MPSWGELAIAPPARPRISRALARRLDRLARRAHRFHRYAHHPLCAAYAGELIRLGRRGRVCRGCALAVLGALAGLALAWALPMQLDRSGLAVCAASLVLGGTAAWRSLRAPAARALGPRADGKWLRRALPAASLAAAFGLGVRSAALPGLALALGSVLVAVAAWTNYRVRGPDRSACLGCPEGPPHAGCSGYAAIVRRERAFVRVARRMLAAR